MHQFRQSKIIWVLQVGFTLLLAQHSFANLNPNKLDEAFLDNRISFFSSKLSDRVVIDKTTIPWSVMISELIPKEFESDSISELKDRVRSLASDLRLMTPGTANYSRAFPGFLQASFEYYLRKQQNRLKSYSKKSVEWQQAFFQGNRFRPQFDIQREEVVRLFRLGKNYLFSTPKRRFRSPVAKVEKTMEFLSVILGQVSDIDAKYTAKLETGQRLNPFEAFIYAEALISLNRHGAAMNQFRRALRSGQPLRYFVRYKLASLYSKKRQWQSFNDAVTQLGMDSRGIDLYLSRYSHSLVVKNSKYIRNPKATLDAFRGADQIALLPSLLHVLYRDVPGSLKPQVAKVASLNTDSVEALLVLMKHFKRSVSSKRIIVNHFRLYNQLATILQGKQESFSSSEATPMQKEFAVFMKQFQIAMGNLLVDHVPSELRAVHIQTMDELLEKILTQRPSRSEKTQLLELRAKLSRMFFEFETASEIYTKLVSLNWLSMQEKEEYAVDMVNAYRTKVLPLLEELPEKVSLNPNFSELETSQENYFEACKLFHQTAPKQLQIRKRCDDDKAKILLNKGLRDDARAQLWLVVGTYPGTREALNAVEVLVGILATNPDELEAGLSKLLKIPAYQGGQMGRVLRHNRRLALLQKIRKVDDLAERANRMFLFARQEADHVLGQKSLLESAELYGKAGYLAKAIESYQIYVRDYPKSKESTNAYLKLGRLSASLFRFEEAVNYLEYYEKKETSQENRRTVAAETCRYAIVLDLGRASKVCASENLDSEEGKKAQLKLVFWLNKKTRPQLLANFVLNVLGKRNDLNPDEKVIAYGSVYDANLGMGRLAEAAKDEMFNLFLEHHSSLNSNSRKILAKLAFKGLDETVDKFSRIYVSGTKAEDYVTALQNKKQTLGEINKNFEKVMATKDPYWGVLALTNLAKSSLDFSNQLRNPPLIDGIDFKSLKAKLDGHANSLNSKAKSYLTGAKKNIAKYQVLSKFNRYVINKNYELEGSALKFEDIVPKTIYSYER